MAPGEDVVPDSLAIASFKARAQAPPPSKAVSQVPPKAVSQAPPSMTGATVPPKAVSQVPEMQAAQAKAGFKAPPSLAPTPPVTPVTVTSPTPMPAAALVPAPNLVPAPLADPAHIDPAWEVPTADESAVPKDDDGEGWLELLRDGYYRQLREENEFKQPPPYPRAINFAAASGHPVAPSKYPRPALDLQRQILMKFRPDPPNPNKGKGMFGKGGKGMMDMGMMGGYGDWNGDWMGGGGGGWNDWSMDWGMMDMM
ncbi:unnamed protein product, partial [Symbiodinium pilosum]